MHLFSPTLLLDPVKFIAWAGKSCHWRHFSISLTFTTDSFSPLCPFSGLGDSSGWWSYISEVMLWVKDVATFISPYLTNKRQQAVFSCTEWTVSGLEKEARNSANKWVALFCYLSWVNADHKFSDQCSVLLLRYLWYQLHSYCFSYREIWKLVPHTWYGVTISLDNGCFSAVSSWWKAHWVVNRPFGIKRSSGIEKTWGNASASQTF